MANVSIAQHLSKYMYVVYDIQRRLKEAGEIIIQ